jgi:hypothetical protein
MLLHPGTRSRAVLCIAAATASCAAFAPAAAWADDDVTPPSPTVTDVVPALDLDVPIDDETEEAIEAAGEAIGAVIDASSDGADAVTSDETAATTEQPAATAEAATEMPPDPALESASEADTTTDSADTATDSTVPATTVGGGALTTTTGSATVPAAPTVNVNVSVRIGSAGDNGSVSQTNAIGAPAQTTPVASSGASRPTNAPAASRVTPASSGPATSPTSPWYWQWNCRDLPMIPVVSPSDSYGESLPTSWTWIWNCADISDQYHSETGDQYQQTNTNISIRISSPGDNGPVTQTNIAISAGGASRIAIPAIGLPTVTVTAPPLTVTTPTITVTAPGVGITIPSIVVETPSSTLAAPVIDPVISGGWGTAADVSVANENASAPTSLVEPADPAAVADGATGAGAHRSITATPPPTDVRTATLGVRAGASAPGVHAGTAREPRQAKPAPRWRPSSFQPEPKAPVSPPAGMSASAAGAAGSSSGGLPIFLALPFLAAVLDLARRVALERATWPSGHRRRIPDTPG